MRGIQLREPLIPTTQPSTHSVIKYKKGNNIMITRTNCIVIMGNGLGKTQIHMIKARARTERL